MKFLFQGDSITDCGRGNYEDPHAMGCGYPRILEAELMAEEENCEVMNCGISGSRIVDLLPAPTLVVPAAFIIPHVDSLLSAAHLTAHPFRQQLSRN